MSTLTGLLLGAAFAAIGAFVAYESFLDLLWSDTFWAQSVLGIVVGLMFFVGGLGLLTR